MSVCVCSVHNSSKVFVVKVREGEGCCYMPHVGNF